MPRQLTYNQRSAALRLAQGVHPVEVARQSRVTRGTLYRWRQRPDFQALVASAAAPCPHTGVPGWLMMMLQGNAEALVWVINDLVRHGNPKALNLAINTLVRCRPEQVGEHQFAPPVGTHPATEHPPDMLPPQAPAQESSSPSLPPRPGAAIQHHGLSTGEARLLAAHAGHADADQHQHPADPGDELGDEYLLLPPLRTPRERAKS